MKKINYIVKSSHLHYGVDPEFVKLTVLADYESKGCFTEKAEKHYCLTADQPIAVNPEVYYLKDCIDMDKVYVGRRGSRQFASLCTPIDNINPEKRVLSSKVMIYYNYDPDTKGVKVYSAFIIREDLEGDYREIYQSGKSLEEISKMTIDEVKDWYLSQGFVLALDPSEWVKFKIGQHTTH